ncbi:MAG TPA: glycosyltransferase [Bryobacteraceae bacterium]
MTPMVLIGIDARGQSDRLAATTRAITAHTPEPHRIIAIETGEKRGGAAAFNALTKFEPADIYVLMECGALPAPGWLRRILTAFSSVPDAGLAGPSTNQAWNRQCVVPAGEQTQDPIALGRIIDRRFGASRRLLEPLHSLADFCYGVKRPVVDALGDADEEYGLGPCWEMDYNVRAHRAGFRGLWVCGAYVHRPPLTPERLATEQQLFEESRRRYQSKFCGLHLRGLKQDFREHCRGDACANFAPRDLIAIRAGDMPKTTAAAGAPLASCIMPTFNRRAFIPSAIAGFLAQDYPRCELIIVDDGADPVRDLIPHDPRIRYLRLETRASVGEKRNIACAEARGDFILHWDDDDWYGRDRVSRQISALLQNNGEACGSSTLYYYSPATQRAFRYEYRGAVTAWLGALAYPKRVWQTHPFDAVDVAEDVKFLAKIPVAARVDLKDPALSIATIHSSNISPKLTNGPFWVPEDAAKMRALMGQNRVDPARMISCIMPTWNRRAFIPLALECFQAQTYPFKELILVDDGDDHIGDLVKDVPDVRYLRLPRRTTIGQKRNAACELASGEFIAHWDDDDWYSPERLARQVNPLLAGTHEITGLTNDFMVEMPRGAFWRTTPDLHRRMFCGDVHGGTIAYRRDLWSGGIQYPNASLAEDAAFIRSATARGKRLLRMENNGEFVYVRHGTNTWKFESGSFLDPAGWRRAEPPGGFTPAILEAYRSVSCQ